MTDHLSFMSRAEGEIQRSLGLAKEYKVRVPAFRKDVYVVCIGEHTALASSDDEAIEIVRHIMYGDDAVKDQSGNKLVYEVSEVNEYI